MSTRGIPISQERRQELGELIDRESLRVDDEIRALVPAEVLSTKQKNGYKVPPILSCDDCHWKGRTDHLCPGESGQEELQQVEYVELAELAGLVQREVVIEGTEEKCHCSKKNRPACHVCLGSGIIPQGTVELRWASPKAFNPNSQKQVIRFMKYLKHPVPKHAKRVDAQGEASDTTEVKELERLYAKTKHPIYLLLIQKRQLTKMRGTYYSGYEPWADEKIHTTYTFQTATWQLSCCAPWIPVLTSVGRKMIADIKVGDLVWTHKRRWRKVTATWVHPEQEMVDVQFSNGYVLTCTTAHRVLVSEYGTEKSVVDTREYQERTGSVSKYRLSDPSNNSSGTQHKLPHDRLDTSPSHASRRMQGAQCAPLFAVEDGSKEPTIRQKGVGDGELDRGSGRWVRVSDLFTQWQAEICPSNCDGAGARFARSAERTGCTSYQRRHEGQSLGQFGPNNNAWASSDTLISAEGHGFVKVEKVIPVGSFPVHDIEVEEDESYESCGVFSHNSRAPNVQNSPVRGKSPFHKTLIDSFNKMMVSSPGHTLINFDYKSFHAQTTACEAGLPDYLRLAKIDIHSFNACHFIKHSERFNLLKMSDADLKTFFKECRKDNRIWTNGLTFNEIRNGKTKSCGLGIGFGMGPRKMYMLYKEDFASQKEVEALWNLIMRELFPGLLKWQNAVKAKAAEDKKLVSRFGAIRHFFDVQRWGRKEQKWIGGEQAEAAIAFLPASNAFGMIRWGMLKLNEQGILEKYRLINSKHDSLKFDCPDELVEQCKAEVTPIMQAPCPMMIYQGVTGLEGLSVEVEAQIGKSDFDLH